MKKKCNRFKKIKKQFYLIKFNLIQVIFKYCKSKITKIIYLKNLKDICKTQIQDNIKVEIISNLENYNSTLYLKIMRSKQICTQSKAYISKYILYQGLIYNVNNVKIQQKMKNNKYSQKKVKK